MPKKPKKSSRRKPKATGARVVTRDQAMATPNPGGLTITPLDSRDHELLRHMRNTESAISGRKDEVPALILEHQGERDPLVVMRLSWAHRLIKAWWQVRDQAKSSKRKEAKL